MSAFDWSPAWDEIEDDIDFEGVEFYELPNGTRLYEGDKFWHSDEQYIVEVTDVMTKVYTGEVGFVGGEGGDCVFYDPDWKQPSDPHTKSHWTDDIHYMSVDTFAEMLDEGDLVAHRGNGLTRPP